MTPDNDNDNNDDDKKLELSITPLPAETTEFGGWLGKMQIFFHTVAVAASILFDDDYGRTEPSCACCLSSLN